MPVPAGVSRARFAWRSPSTVTDLIPADRVVDRIRTDPIPADRVVDRIRTDPIPAELIPADRIRTGADRPRSAREVHREP